MSPKATKIKPVQEYRVSVCRTARATKDIIVFARSASQAEQFALVKASDEDFTGLEESAEYDVTRVLEGPVNKGVADDE